MARKYDIKATLGPDFEFELTPEVLAYELSMDFSNQIIMRCTETGISFGELAALMGIKASTLSEKLNGQNLTLKSIAAMAIALNCDVKAPELIVDPGIAFGSDRSWSVQGTMPTSDQVIPSDGGWPELENTRQASTTVDNKKRSAPSYRFKPEEREAA